MARHSTQARQLMQLGGIGQTTAMALISTVGNAATSPAGAASAPGWAWCPGNTARAASELGRITKAGDAYLRSLLVMGARAVLAAMNLTRPKGPHQPLGPQPGRAPGLLAPVVAIAAKNARIAGPCCSAGAFKDARVSWAGYATDTRTN